MQKRFTEEQIIGVLREAEVDDAVIREVCYKHHLTEQTFFRWWNKYGDMTVSDARKLKDLESENARLKKIVALEGLKKIVAKKMVTPEARREALKVLTKSYDKPLLQNTIGLRRTRDAYIVVTASFSGVTLGQIQLQASP